MHEFRLVMTMLRLFISQRHTPPLLVDPRRRWRSAAAVAAAGLAGGCRMDGGEHTRFGHNYFALESPCASVSEAQHCMLV